MSELLSNEDILDSLFEEGRDTDADSYPSSFQLANRKLLCKFGNETYDIHFRGDLNYWRLIGKIILHNPSLTTARYELSYCSSENDQIVVSKDHDIDEMFFHQSIVGEDVFFLNISEIHDEEPANTSNANEVHEFMFKIVFRGKITVHKVRNCIRRRITKITGRNYTMSYKIAESEYSVSTDEDVVSLFNSQTSMESANSVILSIQCYFDSYSDNASCFDRLSDSRNIVFQYRQELFEVTVRGSPTMDKLGNCLRSRIPSLDSTPYHITYTLDSCPEKTVCNDDDLNEMLSHQLSLGVDALICHLNSEAPVLLNGSMSNVFYRQCSKDLTFSTQSYTTRSRDWRDFIVCENQKFDGGVEEFRIKVLLYAAELGFVIEFTRNEKERVKVICSKSSSELCCWSVYATKDLCLPAFYIRTINNVHTCSGRIRSRTTPMLTAKVVAYLILPLSLIKLPISGACFFLLLWSAN